MNTRAALARALALDPMILFLDEPTAGLDPLLADGFDELIVNLNKALGVTVIMATHDLDTLFSICDRIAVLSNKKLVVDTLRNLLKSKDEWTRKFFHGPRGRGAVLARKETHGNG
jgi:phospholipid/cholesterol/gamma-HCH transport system ATP-binding protein